MIIVVKEETKLGTEYSALKDESGKPTKFKNMAEAEDRLRAAIENSSTASFVVIG